MAISAFAVGPLYVLINSWPNRRLLDYTIGQQVRDILPTALVCIPEALVVFGIDFAGNAAASRMGFDDSGGVFMAFLTIKLTLQFLFGAATFFFLAYAFKLRPMAEYARMTTAAMGTRFPRLSQALDQRFESFRVKSTNTNYP